MLSRKTLVPGLAFFGFAALMCCTPSCKAQEVNPDHFTDKGVETFPERTQPVVKKKTPTAPDLKQANLTQRVVAPRKSARASAKKKTASTSGK